MTIDDIIRHCRRDTRCIGGPERLALCDEVERLRTKIAELEKELNLRNDTVDALIDALAEHIEREGGE